MTQPSEGTGLQRELEGGHTRKNDMDTNVTAVIRVIEQDPKHASKDEVASKGQQSPGVGKNTPNDGGKKRRYVTNRQMYPNKSAKANSGKSDGSFTSKFRGVTRHRLTKRFEAHFWDSSYERPTPKSGKRRKGRQVYLGGYLTEEDAARAYDKAAIAFLGTEANLNFAISDYQEYMNENKGKAADLVVGELRRKSVGFARGSSQYRGVTKNKKCLRWEARIGKVLGNKYLYLGIFDDAKLAAIAYDKAAVKFFGTKAMTNFQLQDYQSILDDPDSYTVPMHAETQGSKETKRKSARTKNASQEPAVQTNPPATHTNTFTLPTYEQQMEWYQHRLRLLQVPEQQMHLPNVERATARQVQPYSTMTYDFEGRRTGYPHQLPISYEKVTNSVDLPNLSPLAASLLSPLGIPKEPYGNARPESSRQEGKIDSASADALRVMAAPSSPCTQAYNLQGGFDLDNLGWIDSVDMDQIAMMLKNVGSPKQGGAYYSR